MLKGDVHGAFRHLRQNTGEVCWMDALVPDQTAGVTDLSAPLAGQARQRSTG